MDLTQNNTLKCNSIVSVSRGLDIAGLTVRKLSFNTTANNNTSREAEVSRKPFAQVKPGNQIVSTTPVSKPLAALVPAEIEEENRPPKTVPIVPSKTPLSAPLPMQVACTPAPVSLKFEEENVKLSPEVEFSFEERRLALYLSR